MGRIYTNHTDHGHYKAVFYEMQKVIELMTGKPLRFKQLSKGGTSLTLNVDLEAAQVLGFGDSFMCTNEPEYSNIHTMDSTALVMYFTRACFSHVKRLILLCTPDVSSSYFPQTNP